jgi:hypothetical protein
VRVEPQAIRVREQPRMALARPVAAPTGEWRAY